MGYTVIQKDNTRYSFIKSTYTSGAPRYQYCVEQNMIFGSSVTYFNTTKESGNALYLELLGKGFKQFRNPREVSWYATVRNNTPYPEEWTTDGKYLVPIDSHSITD